jgi:1-acyl-sn-glycerol-3-phosphate acyltransferase
MRRIAIERAGGEQTSHAADQPFSGIDRDAITPGGMSRSTALDDRVGAHSHRVPGPFLYRILLPPIRRVLEERFDLSVQGVDLLPSTGPCLLAANHHNYLDGIVLAAALARPISFLVMPRVWHASPLHPLFHRHIGSIRLDVTRADVAAFRQALAALAEGRTVGIFPEGPFSVRGRLEPGLHGVALLALRSGVPVVPAGIRGTYEALAGRRFYIPRRHPIRVRFGPARVFARDTADGGREARAAITARVMNDIAALLA